MPGSAKDTRALDSFASSQRSGLGLRTSVYNHQLCTLDKRVWPLAVRSISDWKNEYLPECTRCEEHKRCGGFSLEPRGTANTSALLTHDFHGVEPPRRHTWSHSGAS